MIELKSRQQALRYLETRLQAEQSLIPSLPQVLVRVQKAISNQAVGARELADVILEDPSLTASTLRLANSAFYLHSHAKIRTVTGAIVLLGFETIRNVVLGLSVYNMLSNLPRTRDYRQVWRHSLAVAVGARMFANRLHFAVPEEAFVAGLLHDIGKLILGQFFPEHYAQALNLAIAQNMTQLEAESRLLHCTHVDAGCQLAEFWGFPAEIRRAIACHEYEGDRQALAENEPPLVHVVLIANLLAQQLYGDTPGKVSATRDECSSLAAEFLGLEAGEIEPLLGRLREEVTEVGRLLDIVVDEWRYGSRVGKPGSRGGHVAERAKLEFLLHANEAALSGTDATNYLKDTVHRLFEALELECFMILFPSQVANCLQPRFAYGGGVKEIRNRISVSLDTEDDVAAWAFINRLPVVVEPANLHRFSRLSEHSLATLLGTFNLAAVPVIVGARTIAVAVAARSREAANLADEDVRIISLYLQNFANVLVRGRSKENG